MVNGFRLLVFDWDGTLLDSVEAIVECTRESMRAVGLEPLGEKQVRDLIGLGLRESIDVMCPGCDDGRYREILEAYRRLWVMVYWERSSLFGGAADALARLREDGYLLAVATAKSRRGLARDFERTGVAPLFHASRTVDEAPGKPHPEMLLGLFGELGVQPGEALMVGDTVHDLQMAHNAGTPAVAVAGGAQPRWVLEAQEPLACLETVAELPAWLSDRGQREAPAPGP